MLLLAIFHAGPMGLAPYVPLRWQHGSTPGVTVHGAWVSSGLGTQRVSDGRSFILFECEPPAIAAFINYLKPYSPRIEVLQVANYLPQIRAYEARNPELAPFLANATDDLRRAAVEHTKRYIDAPTPADALRIWLETEPLPMAGIGGAGGAELARSAELIPRLGLES
ncbi:MAG TPA: hypothetical protein VI789_05835 [Dehalococcoidia bacterium]|nr:hypothetical protein [Dehalococcoidia bacterium]